MQPEADARKQLAWAVGMWRKHGHPYDAGYADALAWALGEPSPTRTPEGLKDAPGPPRKGKG